MLFLQLQVRFKTSWSPDETTVHHFEKFLMNFFTFTEQEITLIEVSSSYLVFVCSTPFSATGAIIKIVKEQEELLPQLGVISITVGDYVAFKVTIYICYDACLISILFV